MAGAGSIGAPGGSWTRAFQDLRAGFADWRLWRFLGEHDIRQRYRRSTLGPLWVALSMGINVTCIGLIWSTLFRLNPADFVPYVCLGTIIWNLIVGLGTDGCQAFISAGGYITQTNRPISTYMFWVIWRNLLVASHTFTVYLVVAVVFRIWPHWNTLWIVPGLLVLLAATTWPVLLLGMISARFRDMPQTIQSIFSVLFFVTPVLWQADQLGERAYIAHWNPLAHVIDLVRAPLLGQPLSGFSWAMAIGTAIVGWSFTLAVFARYRSRISYWL
jgi:ABC-2 type transport system permease protein/lipopolysaccharide transport system permease protein